MTTARGASSGVPVTMAVTTTKTKVPRVRIPRIVGRSFQTLIGQSIASERDRNGRHRQGGGHPDQGQRGSRRGTDGYQRMSPSGLDEVEDVAPHRRSNVNGSHRVHQAVSYT